MRSERRGGEWRVSSWHAHDKTAAPGCRTPPLKVPNPSCGHSIRNGKACLRKALSSPRPASRRGIDERLLRCLRHPLGGDGLRVVRCDGLQPALLLQEVRLLGECLCGRTIRAAAEPFRRSLLLEAREAVELHRVRNVLDLAARTFRNRLRLVARRRPFA